MPTTRALLFVWALPILAAFTALEGGTKDLVLLASVCRLVWFCWVALSNPNHARLPLAWLLGFVLLNDLAMLAYVVRIPRTPQAAPPPVVRPVYQPVRRNRAQSMAHRAVDRLQAAVAGADVPAPARRDLARLVTAFRSELDDLARATDALYDHERALRDQRRAIAASARGGEIAAQITASNEAVDAQRAALDLATLQLGQAAQDAVFALGQHDPTRSRALVDELSRVSTATRRTLAELDGRRVA
jgi:hypothetical protein